MFGRDLANLWLDGALHRVIGGREVRIAAAPGGVDVEPLDGETRAGVEKLLGLEFELEPFTAWAAEQPVLSGDRRFAPGLPPAARTGPVREPRDLDHGAAGVADRGVRDPWPLHRAARRPGRRGLCIPDPGEGCRIRRGGARRARLLAAQGRVRDRPRPRRSGSRRASSARPTTRSAHASSQCAGSGRGRPNGSSAATLRARARGRSVTSPCARRSISSTVAMCTSSARASIRSRISPLITS